LTTTSDAVERQRQIDRRRQRLEKLVQITGGDFELGLDFGRHDAVDKRRIIVGLGADDVLQASHLWLRGAALHLLGHHLQDVRQAAEEALLEQRQGKPHFSTLWHALEDARLENWMVGRWPGMRRSFEARWLPNLGGGLFQRMPALQQLELGLYLLGRGVDRPSLRPDVDRALEDVMEPLAAGARGARPGDSLQAMRRIYPRLQAYVDAGITHGRGASATTPQEASESSGGSPSSESQPDTTPTIELEDERFEVSLMGRQRQVPEWVRPGSAPWFERGLGEKQVHPSVLLPDRETALIPPRRELAEYQRLWLAVQREAGYLFTRLLHLMQEQAYLRYGGRHRTGKLVMNKLWKQRLADYRLFERQEQGGRNQVAFMVLVDESASMAGRDKSQTAAKATVLLGEALSRLNVPFEIIGFSTASFEAQAAMKLGLVPAYQYRTTRCAALEHRIYKAFDEPFRFVRTRLAGIEPRHNNWDEEHLVFAYHRMRLRPEPGKVLIVLSDGQPNGSADHLIATVRWLERHGLTVIGVGIGADFVRHIYRQSLVVGDFHQLAQELIQVLVTELGRHGTELSVGAQAPGPGYALTA
jgi:hypothetical protein